MNDLSPNLVTGTVAELLVQLRLLQFGVQAVATHKDTGNDLLATRGEAFRALQVKATRLRDGRITFNRGEGRRWHICALVFLEGDGDDLHLDRSDIYLATKDEITKNVYTAAELAGKECTPARVNDLFTRQLRAL